MKSGIKLNLSAQTVKNHVHRILQNAGAETSHIEETQIVIEKWRVVMRVSFRKSVADILREQSDHFHPGDERRGSIALSIGTSAIVLIGHRQVVSERALQRCGI